MQIAECLILINDPWWVNVLITEWVSYGTTAQYEDMASTTPVNFSPPEKAITGQEDCCPFSVEQSSHVLIIFSLFIPTISIKAAKLRKCQIGSLPKSTPADCLVSYNWANPTIFQTVQWAAAGTKAPLPQRVQAKEGNPLWVTSLIALQLLIF